MSEQTTRPTAREHNLRKYLKTLTDVVMATVDIIDKVMDIPALTAADRDLRGKRIAEITNRLEISNDQARYFGLGIDYRKDKKRVPGKVRAELMASAPALRDEATAYRAALVTIRDQRAPVEEVSDGTPWYECQDCRGCAYTAEHIKHADGCAYVVARDVLARFEGERKSEPINTTRVLVDGDMDTVPSANGCQTVRRLSRALVRVQWRLSPSRPRLPSTTSPQRGRHGRALRTMPGRSMRWYARHGSRWRRGGCSEARRWLCLRWWPRA